MDYVSEIDLIETTVRILDTCCHNENLFQHMLDVKLLKYYYNYQLFLNHYKRIPIAELPQLT
jgi:hypothetical protein